MPRSEKVKVLSDAAVLEGPLNSDSVDYVLRGMVDDIREPFQVAFCKGARGWGFDYQFEFVERNMGLVPDRFEQKIRLIFQDVIDRVEEVLGVEGFFNEGWLRIGDMPGLQGAGWHSDDYAVHGIVIHDLPEGRRCSDIQGIRLAEPWEVLDSTELRGLVKKVREECDRVKLPGTQDVEGMAAILGVQDRNMPETGAEDYVQYDFLHRRFYPRGQAPLKPTVDRLLVGFGWAPNYGSLIGVDEYKRMVETLVNDFGLCGENGDALLGEVMNELSLVTHGISAGM